MIHVVLGVVLALIVIGVLLQLMNTLLPPYIDAKILRLINTFVVVVVAICLLLYVLSIFGLLPVGDIPIPRVR